MTNYYFIRGGDHRNYILVVDFDQITQTSSTNINFATWFKCFMF